MDDQISYESANVIVAVAKHRIQELESKLKAQQELIDSVKDDLRLIASPSEFNCAVGEGNLRACAQRALAKLEER